MIGRVLDDLLAISEKDLAKGCVDCGTCPISMACAVGEGGSGWRFPCCGTTSVTVDGATDQFVVVDCANNGFASTYSNERSMRCPLCSGDVVDGILRGSVGQYRYLRTIHSKVSPKQRLKVLRDRVPVTEEHIRQERKRLKERL